MSEQNKYLKFTVKGDGCEVSLVDNWDTPLNLLYNEINALTEIVIPEEFNGRKVTSIAKEAFKGHPMWSVSIPDTVENIGVSAFKDCEGLTEVVVPPAVEKIGSFAFSGCKNLQKVHLVDGLKEIDGNAFACCSSLKNISIPNSVTKIGTGAFFGSGLTEITIPGSVKAIATFTFQGCRRLVTVNISEGVEEIHEMAFGPGIHGCENLVNVSIPNSMKYVDGDAFVGCPNIDKSVLATCCAITLEHLEEMEKEDRERALYTIERDSIYDRKIITNYKMKPYGPSELILPASDEKDKYPLTAVGKGAFKASESLVKLTIPSSIGKIEDYAFEDCKNLKTLVFAEDETARTVEIGMSAFANCTNLTEIIVPGNVGLKLSGELSFWGCPVQPKEKKIKPAKSIKSKKSTEDKIVRGCGTFAGIIALALLALIIWVVSAVV